MDHQDEKAHEAANIAVSVFRNFWDKEPVASTLEAVISAIRSDSRTKELTTGYRQQHLDALKNESMLFAVPCVFSGGKAQKNVVRLTGLSMVDFDHISLTPDPSPKGEGSDYLGLKEKIMADPHTLLCHVTISGRGLRVLYRYELDGTFELKRQMQFYRKAFAAGNAYYERLVGAEADGKCKNVTRLSVICHDGEVYYNPQAEPFTAAWIEDEWARMQEPQREQRKRQRELARIRALYERTIRPEVEAEGAVYAAGSHNDYVMRVGYRLNQFGFSLGAATEWAAQQFADYERTADIIAACYQKEEEHGSRGGQKRCRGSDESAKGVATVEEIKAFLREHIQLRHNVITGRVESLTPGPIPEQSSPTRSLSPKGEGSEMSWQPITDRVVNSLWAELSRQKAAKAQDIYRVIESDFVPEFHPFREYLDGLSSMESRTEGEAPPDAKSQNPEILRARDPIRELAETVTVKGGEAEQTLFYEYLKKWLVGMVAGWIDPAVVNNVILVLIGEQGSYKTTWFNFLLPPPLSQYFYTKTNANRMGRDDLLTLAQYGLVCCEELDTMRPSELNQLKAAVTMPSIDERAAYAHYHEHRKHIASFCGTGNNAQFLSDPTGNRRWLPFEVERIVSPREHPFDYEGIYAQAYALYREGFRYWFTRDEIVRLSEHNRQFETPRLEHELVQLYFRRPGERETGEFMSVALALQIVGAGITQKLSTVSLGRAFVEQGYERKTYRNTRGYIVVRRSAEEMRLMRYAMAHDATSEGAAFDPSTKESRAIHITDDTDVF